MLDSRIQHLFSSNRRNIGFVIVLILAASAVLGMRASPRVIAFSVVTVVGIALLGDYRLGILGLMAAALVVPLEIGTGTEVKLNAVALLLPVLFVLWLFKGIRQRRLSWVRSPVNRLLLFFVLAGLLSLLIGNVIWDPAVPKSGNFLLVQLAQWAIFALSALAFWLIANMEDIHIWLPRLTWGFLYLGGCLAILRLVPGMGGFVESFRTITFIRAPFWVLLAALAGGQLLFNPGLNGERRVFLFAVLAAVLYYAFISQREAVSNGVGVAAVGGVLVWLRFTKLRVVIVMGTVLLILTGILFPSLYAFAGGDDEWITSGGSRLALIERVVSVTLRNPLTGLGPASYRNYANIEPLKYRNAIWFDPKINSHNNYVDIFAHTGLLGLGLFLWFLGELGWMGWQRSIQHRTGFVGGYVNGMFAAWVSSLVIMMVLDWILPFVYNVGFPGFQASVLVWLFWGGLVAMDQWDKNHPTPQEQ